MRNGKPQFGLLVCTTGVGMSIAANKVPGVRAALVADERTAALARQHNNANVLCLAGKTTPPELAQRDRRRVSQPAFEGGRHERRVSKMETHFVRRDMRLRAVDPEIAERH